MPVNSEGCTIQLDGSPVTLRYTLGAAKKVNGLFGDFVTAWQRVAKLDFNAVCIAVAAGLGKEVADVEEPVFRSEWSKFTPDISLFLSWLSNGGKDPRLVVEKKDGGSGNV